MTRKGVITIQPTYDPTKDPGQTIANGRKGGSEEALLAVVDRTIPEHFSVIQQTLTKIGEIAKVMPNNIDRREITSCVTSINTELHYLREKVD